MFNSLVIDYMTKVIHWKSDMTHSDVHGRIDKKKKHWEICIETSQCLISIIEMFFSNLPMFFRFSKRTKGQKDTYDWFFVKFGGKFFSAHLANSVSAYIFL